MTLGTPIGNARMAAVPIDVPADPPQRQDLVLEAIIAGAVLSIGHQEAEGVQPAKTTRRAQIRACAQNNV